MAAAARDEFGRKLLHIAFGICALALRDLSWWQAVLMALTALAFNLFVLPTIAASLYRPSERGRAINSGIVLYPAAVLGLILLFPDRQDIAGASWAILACGDGMATLAGKRFGGPAIPWNREKTVGGTLAFIVCGGLAGTVLAWWCRPVVTPLPDMWFTAGAPIAAAIVAALVETLPIRLDDNVSVTASAAGTLWALSLVQADLLVAAVAGGMSALVVACLVNIPVALAGWKAGTVTRGGAVCGATIGVAIGASTGWPGWVLLFATFAMATACSRLGLRRKMLLGIAEERGGRRGVGNAIANTGIAMVASILSVLTSSADAARVAFVAALAAGGSDTAASEIGKAWGQRTWLVPTFRRVPPGTSGAVSLEGTIAGVAGAALLGGLGIALGLVPHATILAVVVGATIGSLAESVLGATLEASSVLNNDVLNFLNTSIAAAAALLVDGLMR